MNVEQLKEALDDYGDHVDVFVEDLEGETYAIDEVTYTSSSGVTGVLLTLTARED